MPSEPLLDIPALIAPIEGENPAGSSVPFEVKEKLEEGRKSDNPDDYADDDPMRPETFKQADWAGVIRLAQETLTETSKDLLVTARLTEALVEEHGYVGLRDGLHLLCELAENCWDRLYPDIDDGDVEVRAGPFNWLDEPDRGARFPNTLRRTPFLIGEEIRISWQDWKLSQEGRGKITSADFEKAVELTPIEQCRLAADALGQSDELLTRLTTLLNEKMGEYSPGLTGLRQAVEECHALARQIVLRKSGGETVDAADTPAAGDAPADGSVGGGGAAKPAATRAQAYRQLAQAAAVLQKLEPHSPIPYFVQRAVELGELSFPDLMKELIRDTNILAELNRELGIKEPDGEY